MPKINVLPKAVADLIAAGEVVERPLSVVKELVENSIDAGADRITVEIKNGGIRYIRVTDNGCGIDRADVPTAFVSHATSKIRAAEDLSGIFTLGFRGEALPSVAAVSRLELLTKTADAEEGTAFRIEGGVAGEPESAGCPEGTTVVVRDLFFNTPARMKFLKRDVTEGNYVADTVTRTALSHPEIRFTLIRDEKRVLATPGDGDLRNAVYAVFGKETAGALLPCSYERDGVRVEGYVSRPLNNRPNRGMQYFFVNGRSVRIPAAAPALDNAYKNSIMVGKFPMCFLNIGIDATKTDVNVHPAKTEIRFADDGKIYEAVFFAARAALSAGDVGRPSLHLQSDARLLRERQPGATQMKMTELPFVESAPAEKTPPAAAARPGPRPQPPEARRDVRIDVAYEEPPVPEKKVLRDGGALVRGESALASSAVNGKTVDPFAGLRDAGASAPGEVRSSPQDEISSAAPAESPPTQPAPPPEPDFAGFAAEPPKETFDFSSAPPAETADRPPVYVLGEVFGTYIVAEYGSKLLLIDKHAAHERLLYNELRNNAGAADAQLLLQPVTVSLSGREYAAVSDNLALLEKAGFETEPFGGNAVLVRTCPVRLIREDVASLIAEIAGELARGNNAPEPEKLTWLYESAACRAAVKAGDALRPEEMRQFVEKLLRDDALRYCPHGRPVMFELTKYEIEKQFGRVQ